MNHSKKPLSFSQEIQLERYLYIMQELLSNPEQQTNREVIEALEDASKDISQFLTVEEITEIEETSLVFPETMKAQETIDFSLLLPRGWSASDYEAGNPETVIDNKRKTITFTCVIHMKDQDER